MRAPRQSLVRKQELQLAFWLKEANLDGIYTLEKLCEQAHAVLGFDVGKSTLRGVMRDIGRELPTAPDMLNGNGRNPASLLNRVVALERMYTDTLAALEKRMLALEQGRK